MLITGLAEYNHLIKARTTEYSPEGHLGTWRPKGINLNSGRPNILVKGVLTPGYRLLGSAGSYILVKSGMVRTAEEPLQWSAWGMCYNFFHCPSDKLGDTCCIHFHIMSCRCVWIQIALYICSSVLSSILIRAQGQTCAPLLSCWMAPVQKVIMVGFLSQVGMKM